MTQQGTGGTLPNNNIRELYRKASVRRKSTGSISCSNCTKTSQLSKPISVSLVLLILQLTSLNSNTSNNTYTSSGCLHSTSDGYIVHRAKKPHTIASPLIRYRTDSSITAKRSLSSQSDRQYYRTIHNQLMVTGKCLRKTIPY